MKKEDNIPYKARNLELLQKFDENMGYILEPLEENETPYHFQIKYTKSYTADPWKKHLVVSLELNMYDLMKIVAQKLLERQKEYVPM